MGLAILAHPVCGETQPWGPEAGRGKPHGALTILTQRLEGFPFLSLLEHLYNLTWPSSCSLSSLSFYFF